MRRPIISSLAQATRRRASSADGSDLLPHDHLAWSGEGPESLDRLAVAAFTTAARRGERMIFICDDPRPSRLAALAGHEQLIASGAMSFARTADLYGGTDLAVRIDVLDQLLAESAAKGFSGTCVVAEDTGLAAGTAQDFEAWLAWESIVDRVLAERPLTGICFFDRRRVSPERLADLAAVHPVLSNTFDPPSFQLVHGGDSLHVSGALETFDVERLRRLLAAMPELGLLAIELSEAEFVNHRSLLVLNDAARRVGGLRVRGSSAFVRRLFTFLDLSVPALEFA